MTFEALFKSTAAAARSLRVRSALNPMLWLTLTGGLLFLAAAVIFRDDDFLKYACVSVASLPVLATVAGFAYFLLKSPEKLQSEDFQLRHETLQFIQSKSGPVPLQPTSINALTNPALPSLAGGEEDGQ